jgi:hypothetical protein
LVDNCTQRCNTQLSILEETLLPFVHEIHKKYTKNFVMTANSTSVCFNFDLHRELRRHVMHSMIFH